MSAAAVEQRKPSQGTLRAASKRVTLTPHETENMLVNLKQKSQQDDWYFLDGANAPQGPFPKAHIQAWLNDGYFTGETLVSHAGKPWTPLKIALNE